MTLTAVAALVMFSLPLAQAAEEHQHAKAGTPAAAPADMNAEMMEKMQDNMLKMHDLMHRIHDAKTPQERETLKQEHMNAMKMHMKMMQGMMGSMKDGMKKDDAKGGMTGH
jgi:Xaa-Pro aminopeptidase